MKPGSTIQTRKPFFAGFSFACLLLALPAGRLAVFFFAPAEDYLGYGGLGIALAGFLLTLVVGTALGLVSFLRREFPRQLSFLGFFANATVLVWVLCNLPGR